MSNDARLTLDDWAALSAEERNRLIGSWFTTARLKARWSAVDEVPDTPLHAILTEAVARFGDQYGGHPLVVGISAVGPDGSDETCIVALTRLAPPQRVEELPTLYMTFPVRQQAMAIQRWGYVETWRLILAHLAGWTEEQVTAFVARKDEQLWGGDPFLYHEVPAYWVADRLIPPSILQAISGTELSGVLSRIAAAVGEVLGEEEYDWEAARARVAEVVAGAQRGETA